MIGLVGRYFSLLSPESSVSASSDAISLSEKLAGPAGFNKPPRIGSYYETTTEWGESDKTQLGGEWITLAGGSVFLKLYP